MRWIALLCFLMTPSVAWAQQRPTRPTAPPVVPPGFAVETILDGLRGPSAFVFAPDGRILLLERGSATGEPSNRGAVRVVKGKSLVEKPALTLDVCGEGERGLLGIALDPAFARNGYLYLYYTRRAGAGAPCGFQEPVTGPRNRVSRFTMSGDAIDPRSERVLIDSITSVTSLHNAGDLRFDRSGNLFISTGDNDLPRSPAPDPASLMGKILRIRPTAEGEDAYTIPADNPFAEAATARSCGRQEPGTPGGPCKEVWAFGLRNPFRITVDPATDALYAFDVGVNAWEEIDQIEPGANYGYPQREGWCSRGVICPDRTPVPGLVDPIWAYPHLDGSSGLDSSVVGGPVYQGGSYPAGYRGSLFFGDWVQGWIKRLHREGDRWQATDFASNLGPVIGIAAGPDGDVYFLDYAGESGNTLRRFVYRER
jgi:glucose/arabinose dehydrogenase